MTTHTRPKKQSAGSRSLTQVNRDLSQAETCANRLTQKLLELKTQKILRNSLQPDTTEFEILEFYGDSFLLERISFFLMTTRRFMNPHLMTQFRISCVRNDNLALVFDELHFEKLLKSVPSTLKGKADVVEAIIGELGEAESQESEAVTAPLNELLAFIAYLGEKAHFQSLALAETQSATQEKAAEPPKRSASSNPKNTQKNTNNTKQAPKPAPARSADPEQPPQLLKKQQQPAQQEETFPPLIYHPYSASREAAHPKEKPAENPRQKESMPHPEITLVPPSKTSPRTSSSVSPPNSYFGNNHSPQKPTITSQRSAHHSNPLPKTEPILSRNPPEGEKQSFGNNANASRPQPTTALSFCTAPILDILSSLEYPNPRPPPVGAHDTNFNRTH